MHASQKALAAAESDIDFPRKLALLFVAINLLGLQRVLTSNVLLYFRTRKIEGKVETFASQIAIIMNDYSRILVIFVDNAAMGRCQVDFHNCKNAWLLE